MAKASATTKTSSGIGAVLGPLVKDPQIQQTIIAAIVEWITGLLRRAPKPPPPVDPVTTPTPAPVQVSDEFPDDHIPAPVVSGREVKRVELKIGRIQLSKERFPAAYTDDNPFGLMQPRPVMEGGNMPWASKFWLDLTAYDKDGREFLRPDVLAHGLAFQTEHHCGDAFVKGNGADATGNEPAAEYQTNDTDAIGHGETAWVSSLGFLLQMKAWPSADGKSFECWGSVNGVKSNVFKLKVS